MTIWELMALPFAECLVLVGIHSYLGVHVLKRKVIFVDLAFAQIAALGTTVAYLFGLQPTGPGAYVFSLLFTIIAAAVFAVTRLRDERIPQEAIIGLTYALAASLAILVIDRAPHGAEHIKDIMAGSILWVRGKDVAVAGAVYSLVGLFHFVFLDRFLLISDDVEEARRRGINVRLWDFLFYVSFGLVISLSVRVAGVLLVFVFLIVPAMLGLLITRKLRLQLLLGWGIGTVVSVVGLWLSDVADLPAGPAVVSFYGLVLVVVALLVYVKRAAPRKKALARVMAGALVVVGLAGVLWGLGSLLSGSPFWEGPGHHHGDLQVLPSEQLDPAHTEGSGTQSAPKDPVAGLLRELEDLDLVGKTERLSRVPDAASLLALQGRTLDEETRFLAASRLLALDRKAGALALVEVLEHSSIPIFRSDALDLLESALGESFGMDAFEEPGAASNEEGLARLKSAIRSRLR